MGIRGNWLAAAVAGLLVCGSAAGRGAMPPRPAWTQSLDSVVRIVGVQTQSWSGSSRALAAPAQRFAQWDHLPPKTTDGLSIGAGFAFAPHGVYLTNRHVVAGATDVVVILRDGRQCVAHPIASDAAIDLSVLVAPGCATTPLQPSRTPPYPGEPAVAVGTPYGFGQSISTGVISGPVDGAPIAHSPEQTLLQSDVAMNPGNSGGPLLDWRGRVIGINTSIWSPTGSSIGLSFSIPEDLIWPAVTEMLRYGHVWRGRLGLAVVARQRQGIPDGAQVVGVSAHGSGSRAGVRPGDLLTGLNGQRIATVSGFTWRLGLIPPEHPFCLTGRRGRHTRRWCGRMGWPSAAWPGLESGRQ